MVGTPKELLSNLIIKVNDIHKSVQGPEACSAVTGPIPQFNQSEGGPIEHKFDFEPQPCRVLWR